MITNRDRYHIAMIWDGIAIIHGVANFPHVSPLLHKILDQCILKQAILLLKLFDQCTSFSSEQAYTAGSLYTLAFG